jgi:hypothetical protein
MIYEVRKDDITVEIDDNILFDNQPKKFKNLFSELKDDDIADFDNCTILVLKTGRVIITIKLEEDGAV